MSNQDPNKQPMQPKRLPGRAYTLVVTGLATILIAVPWLQSQNKVWKSSAVVHHVPLETGLVEAVVRDKLQLAIDQASTTNLSKAVVPDLKSLRSMTEFSTTETPDGEERLTTIQVRNANRELSADVAGILARELSQTASVDDQTAAVVSIDSSVDSQLDRSGLAQVGLIAICLGAITLIYPRGVATKKQPVSIEQFEASTDLPTLGSVFPSDKPTANRQASNTPLRVTVLVAETVVAVAFLLMVFTSAINASSATDLLGNPLETYSETVRIFWQSR
ncbi:MAG: hypothetical protein GY768_20700 [Planctomycetaceae bacterium]|nr:hypothetical protein [Planctomycetaceae bacterium]